MGTIDNQNQRLPRIAGQQADVAVGSPVALLAVFTSIVRERFKADSGLPWIWSPNPTPAASEENTPNAPRKILIEPAFNENTEVRNYTPAIYVDRSEVTPGKVAIGNFIGQQLHTGHRGFYAMATVPIDVEVVSDRKGESATLADIVWFFLLGGREQIRSSFGFHELTPPILGRTVPFEHNKTAWSTHISFEAQFDLRWSTLPISLKLKDVKMQWSMTFGGQLVTAETYIPTPPPPGPEET